LAYPGLLWYLARTEGVDAKRFNEMVNFQSGRVGLSETRSDMRDSPGKTSAGSVEPRLSKQLAKR
jgi:acetate kinase